MVKCPYCKATHVANTIFCSECGNYLLHDDDRQTNPLEEAANGMDQADPFDDPPEEVRIAALLTRKNRSPSIGLKIGDQNQEIRFTLDRNILLGRVDPATNVFPEIDLSDNGSMSKGISRRHAQILHNENKIVIEDLASVNGTFLNGKRLSPYLPEPLSDGDTVFLGKLPIKITIPE
jgi:pSer/pThr/pTyr-binding forkhead associated (FHA) protein